VSHVPFQKLQIEPVHCRQVQQFTQGVLKHASPLDC
jgi:hypothetical protein